MIYLHNNQGVIYVQPLTSCKISPYIDMVCDLKILQQHVGLHVQDLTSHKRSHIYIPTKSHSCLPNLTPDISRKMYYFILDLTPGALILKYCTISGKWKSHSSACLTLVSYVYTWWADNTAITLPLHA